jgi:hypothetical protein
VILSAATGNELNNREENSAHVAKIYPNSLLFEDNDNLIIAFSDSG